MATIVELRGIGGVGLDAFVWFQWPHTALETIVMPGFFTFLRSNSLFRLLPVLDVHQALKNIWIFYFS